MNDIIMNEKNLGKVPHSCILQLQAVYGNLKSAEKKAADFLLENPEVMIDLNIVDFAERAGCSEATIVRLSKKLGYEGYPELKKDFEEYLQSGRSFEYENIEKSDSPMTVVRKVFESSVTAIQDTMAILDEGEYLKANRAIVDSGRIMFCGVGDASAVAMEAYQRFTRIGKQSLFALDADLQLIQASQLEKGDVVIAISHSGYSKTVINTVKTAKDAGATVISVTNYPVSPLAKRSDIILQTAVFLRTRNGEVMSKRITALCLIESLYMNYLLSHEDECIERLRISDEIVKVNKM